MFTDNIIKLDYRLSDDELRLLFVELQITAESGFKNREKFDVVFFMLVGDIVKFAPFAFIRKGQKGIEFEKDYYRALAKMSSSTAECAKSLVNKEDSDLSIYRSDNPSFEFDIDSILDKILEKGIESLTDIELQQLDTFAGGAPKNTNEFNLHANQSSNIDNHNKRSNSDSESNLGKEKEADSEELKTFMNIANAMMKDSPRNKRRWVNKYKNHPFYAIVAGVINGKYDAEEMEKRIIKFLKKRNN
jgi:hypothetical protein